MEGESDSEAILREIPDMLPDPNWRPTMQLALKAARELATGYAENAVPVSLANLIRYCEECLEGDYVNDRAGLRRLVDQFGSND